MRVARDGNVMKLPQHGLLIADDLTGALDSAVFFAEHGWAVSVRDWRAVSATDLPRGKKYPVLLAVDTNSRDLSPQDASDRIALLVARLAPLPPGGLVFKKVDSRLKGNVLAETVALASAIGRPSLLVCPAVPDAGRLVDNGMLVHGDTATRLPEWPAAFSVHCPDVRNEAQLGRVARNMLATAGSVIAVGARGLAKCIAEALPPVIGPSTADRARLELPIAFIIGTNDPVTMAQVEHLRVTGSIREVLFPATQKVDTAATGDLLLRLAVSSKEEFEAHLVSFVRWAERVATHAGARTLVVSGGDTLRALADSQGWHDFAPLRSLGNGLVLSKAGGTGGPLVVSKSGGFGHVQALSELMTDANGSL
jgi:uncharacterized protein YgbK (DUF1537 family)